MKRRRRVTKWVIAAALLLIGGAIINVAVACAAVIIYAHSYPYCGQSKTEIPNTAADAKMWSRYATESWPNEPPPWHSECRHVAASSRRLAVSVMWTGMVSMAETAAQRRERLRGTGTFGIFRLEYGLPLSCCAVERVSEAGSIDVAGISMANDGFSFAGTVFPKKILWPGFAINTLFYAALLWMLFAAPIALRRKRRRKRGLCPTCAYPIGTSPVCTECGEAVKRLTA